MIGVLCNPRDEEKLAQMLHQQLSPQLIGRPMPILVFSIQNLNLIDDSVFGSLVSAEGVTPQKADLPDLIFNFSVQHQLTDIQKLRQLTEDQRLTVINPTNRLDQFVVLQALSSSPETSRYLLPFHKINLKRGSAELEKFSRFLLKPLCGTSLAAIQLGRYSEEGCELIGLQGKSQVHVSSLGSDVSPVLQKKSWVLFELPESTPEDEIPSVTRTFFVRDFSGKWNLLTHQCATGREGENGRFGRWLEPVMQNILQTVQHPMPDLVLCFVDLLHLQGQLPCFLSLGGWQSSLLNIKQPPTVRHQLSEAVFDYAVRFLDEKSNGAELS